MIDEATPRPVNLPEIYSVPDDKGKVCTLASLEATVVLWPKGDESQEVRIEMPDHVTAAANASKCPGVPSTPLLVITWSSFQLCFYVSKVNSSSCGTFVLFQTGASPHEPVAIRIVAVIRIGKGSMEQFADDSLFRNSNDLNSISQYLNPNHSN